MIKQLYQTLLFSILLLTAGCKEKPTTLTVETTTFGNQPIEDVQVEVKAGVQDSGQLIFEPKMEITNAEGKARFEYSEDVLPGQSGFVAVDVVTIYQQDTITNVDDIIPRENNYISIQIPD